MIPLLSYPISIIFDKNAVKKEYLALLYMTIIFSIVFYYLGFKNAYYTKIKDTKNNYYIETVDFIRGLNLTNEDEVFMIGCEKSLLYVDTNTIPNNKYIYQYYYDYLCESEYHFEDFKREVDNKPPKVVVEDTYNLYNVSKLKTYDYIKEKTKDYTVIFNNVEFKVYMRK